MSKKIKILFLSANPDDAGQIQLAEEVHKIDLKLQLSKLRDSFKFITAWAVRPHELQHLLSKHQPHIVQFSGHGTEGGAIVLQNDSGESAPVSPDALQELLQILKGNLQIVVLNACFTAIQGEAISKVIDFTVGMKEKILDDAAVEFSASFYQNLADGQSVKEAFELGRNQIKLAGLDSDVAVLLVRLGADSSRALARKEPKKLKATKKAEDKPRKVNKSVTIEGNMKNGNISTGDGNLFIKS